MSFRADVSNSESATDWKSSKASAYLSRSAGRAPTKLSGSSPTSRWRDRHPQEPILRLHQCQHNPGTHSETPPAYETVSQLTRAGQKKNSFEKQKHNSIEQRYAKVRGKERGSDGVPIRESRAVRAVTGEYRRLREPGRPSTGL